MLIVIHNQLSPQILIDINIGPNVNPELTISTSNLNHILDDLTKGKHVYTMPLNIDLIII